MIRNWFATIKTRTKLKTVTQMGSKIAIDLWYDQCCY